MDFDYNPRRTRINSPGFLKRMYLAVKAILRKPTAESEVRLSTIGDPFLLGGRARRNGHPSENNPFPKNTTERFFWDEGFRHVGFDVNPAEDDEILPSGPMHPRQTSSTTVLTA